MPNYVLVRPYFIGFFFLDIAGRAMAIRFVSTSVSVTQNQIILWRGASARRSGSTREGDVKLEKFVAFTFIIY